MNSGLNPVGPGALFFSSQVWFFLLFTISEFQGSAESTGFAEWFTGALLFVCLAPLFFFCVLA